MHIIKNYNKLYLFISDFAFSGGSGLPLPFNPNGMGIDTAFKTPFIPHPSVGGAAVSLQPLFPTANLMQVALAQHSAALGISHFHSAEQNNQTEETPKRGVINGRRKGSMPNDVFTIKPPVTPPPSDNTPGMKRDKFSFEFTPGRV